VASEIVPAARTAAASAASRRNGARGVRMGTLSQREVTSGCPSDLFENRGTVGA
jgi:hypothetical protein